MSRFCPTKRGNTAQCKKSSRVVEQIIPQVAPARESNVYIYTRACKLPVNLLLINVRLFAGDSSLLLPCVRARARQVVA